MKKIILSYLLFLLVFTRGNAQVMDWTHELREDNNGVTIYDATIDDNGNIYLVGAFVHFLDLNPNGVPYLVTDSSYVPKFFAAKYTSSFNLIWSLNINGFTTYSSPHDFKIYVDENYNVFVNGKANSSLNGLDFDPGPGVASLPGTINSFVAKYSSNGNFIAVDNFSSGNIAFPLYHPSANIYYNYAALELTAFDQNLNILWSKPVVGMPVLMTDSDFYTINGFYSFDVNGSNMNTTLNLYHYSSVGDVISSKLIGQTSGVVPSQIYCRYLSAKGSKIILTGTFWGEYDFGSGADTIHLSNSDVAQGWDPINQQVTYFPVHREFFAEIDTMGNIIWAKKFNTNYSSPQPGDIAIDNAGGIYLCGQLAGIYDFDPDSLSPFNVNNGQGYYVAKYDSGFNFIESEFFNRASSVTTRFKMINEFALVFGSTHGNVDIDFTVDSNSVAYNGGFISKYSHFTINVPIVFTGGDHSPISAGPNPSTGAFNLKFYKNITAGKLTIFDSLGQLVYSQEINGDSKMIDLSGFRSGLYVANLYDGGNLSSIRLIKSSH